jgi:PHP family Zn ribbon phosphoesterase
VIDEYRKAIGHFGSEFAILLDASEEELSSCLPERITEAVMRTRRGELIIEPGYDGVYGTIKIFKEEELKEASSKQLELF